MKRLAILAALFAATTQTADAQVDLSTYADANGFIDVQKLNCAQLAGTWQGDADMLTNWYSGWYESTTWISERAGKPSTRSSCTAKRIPNN